jgi:hypothetical protein
VTLFVDEIDKVRYITNAANKVFKGNTSDVTAYCHTNGEKVNIPIQNNIPQMAVDLL